MDTKTTPQARRHFLASLAALPLVGGLFAPRSQIELSGPLRGAHLIGVFNDGRESQVENHDEVLDHVEWRDGELWIYVKAMRME